MPKIGLKNLSDEDILAAALLAVEGLEFSTVEIGVSCANEKEKPRIRKLLENYFSASLGKKISKIGFDLYFIINMDRGIAEAVPSSVCIEGRYNKFSREIAQTFHYCYKCKGRGCSFCGYKGKLSEISVQELLGSGLLAAFASTESKFHGCGREDVDVRMLGKGRPFVFEALFPAKRLADLKQLEKEINSAYEGKIAVHDLTFCSSDRIVQIKNTGFRKIYSAKCSCEEGISDKELQNLPQDEFKIVQRTPERVEKRRADKEREKSAKILKANAATKTEFTIEMLASHGLYIKELISSDGGRTLPSISSMLGKKCVCTQLDVLEIVIEK
ncbi:MAG TPA: tRNA pseudouridine(54/55) synthase Pus10 [archaeon]|nr:tRNA pseudouridine(54/55) synthase Pus10 [archaeon]